MHKSFISKYHHLLKVTLKLFPAPVSAQGLTGQALEEPCLPGSLNHWPSSAPTRIRPYPHKKSWGVTAYTPFVPVMWFQQLNQLFTSSSFSSNVEQIINFLTGKTVINLPCPHLDEDEEHHWVAGSPHPTPGPMGDTPCSPVTSTSARFTKLRVPTTQGPFWAGGGFLKIRDEFVF